MLLLAAGDQTVCTRYHGNAGDGYRGLAFLPDGRSLPTLNQSDELIMIVPAGPLDTLVTYVSSEGVTSARLPTFAFSEPCMRKFDLFPLSSPPCFCPRLRSPKSRRAPRRRRARPVPHRGRAMRAEMMRPGERLEGWDRGGADPDSELRALGADRFYQLNRTVDGTGVTDPHRPADPPISRRRAGGWSTAMARPASALDHPQVDFLPFSERYVIALALHLVPAERRRLLPQPQPCPALRGARRAGERGRRDTSR